MQLVQLFPAQSSDEIFHYIDLLYLELFGKSSLMSDDNKDRIKKAWLLSKQSHWAFKVVDDNEVVAFFTMAESFSFFAHGTYGIINELWVEPKFRSKGVGSKVLDLVKKFSMERNWHRIDVSAPSSDEWLQTFEFYQHNGFVFTGKKLKYIMT